MQMTYGFHSDLDNCLNLIGNVYNDNVDYNLIPVTHRNDANYYYEFIKNYPLWMKYYILNVTAVDGHSQKL